MTPKAGPFGDSKNEYPWGPEWDGSKANTYESGLSRTTAVGMYPHGAVKDLRMMDMSGNVWEWCLSSYDDPRSEDFKTPEKVSRASARVVRGGSWSGYQVNARAAYRDRLNPAARQAREVQPPLSRIIS